MKRSIKCLSLSETEELNDSISHLLIEAGTINIIANRYKRLNTSKSVGVVELYIKRNLHTQGIPEFDRIINSINRLVKEGKVPQPNRGLFEFCCSSLDIDTVSNQVEDFKIKHIIKEVCKLNEVPCPKFPRKRKRNT